MRCWAGRPASGRSISNTLFIACGSATGASVLEATTNGDLQVVSSGQLLQQPFWLDGSAPGPLPDGHTAAWLRVRGAPQHPRRRWLLGGPGNVATNLVDWQVLTVLPNPTGYLEYDDTAPATIPRRFYRLGR